MLVKSDQCLPLSVRSRGCMLRSMGMLARSDLTRQPLGHTDVARWSQLAQALLGRLGNRQSIDEAAQRRWCHALTTRECFELLVGIFHSVAAHDGLNGFGQQLPI